MEFPQRPQKEVFPVPGTRFVNGIVNQLELLLVQTDDYFSEISIFFIAHDLASARSSFTGLRQFTRQRLAQFGGGSTTAMASISTMSSGTTRALISIVELAGGSVGKYRARTSCTAGR